MNRFLAVLPLRRKFPNREKPALFEGKRTKYSFFVSQSIMAPLLTKSKALFAIFSIKIELSQLFPTFGGFISRFNCYFEPKTLALGLGTYLKAMPVFILGFLKKI